MKGISLIELLLVFAITGLLVFLAVPVSLDFYRSQEMNINSREVLETLRRARLRAVSQEMDSSFGVHFASNSFTLFAGSSYAGRDSRYDEVFTLAAGISISGSEVVFAKLSGTPGAAGIVQLQSGNKTVVVSINAVGAIDIQ